MCFFNEFVCIDASVHDAATMIRLYYPLRKHVRAIYSNISRL